MPFARPYYMGVIRVKVGSYFRRFALKISTLPLTRRSCAENIDFASAPDLNREKQRITPI